MNSDPIRPVFAIEFVVAEPFRFLRHINVGPDVADILQSLALTPVLRMLSNGA